MKPKLDQCLPMPAPAAADGGTAYRMGYERFENPHPPGSVDYALWEDQWLEDKDHQS